MYSEVARSFLFTEGLSWQVRQDGVTGKRRMRAVFRLAGAVYDLPPRGHPVCWRLLRPKHPASTQTGGLRRC